MKEYNIIVDNDAAGERIDKYLSTLEDMPSRSYLQGLLKEGSIYVNDKPVKPNYRLSSDDSIFFVIPDPVEVEIAPENIPLDILYEDDDIIVVNKPKGMVVHPSAGHESGTLVNALMYHCEDNLSGINGELRPGIVHRIDMDTTGSLVICKNDNAHRSIAEQLKVHSITRKYRAIVIGRLSEDGTVDAPIGRNENDRLKMAINHKNGKEAVTHYRILEQFNKYTYIECQLETGRTHQIRVHMASIHHPILGDTVYGPEKQPFNLQGQTLHAAVIGFIHPSTGEYVEFEAPLPVYFEELLKKLRLMT
ncbi:MAG: RluA family pseudouridine synthase [Lachnospiraceae bacterium]|nr:RluA family pseudouridine synthase [Lachnospiraceae bacterium]